MKIIEDLHYCSYVGDIHPGWTDHGGPVVLYTPFPQHVKEAWERRNHPNLHMVFYENLKANPIDEITKLDKFLGTDLTAAQIDKIRHYTSFSEMQARNNMTNTQRVDNVKVNHDIEKERGGFFRKGVAGSWKKHLSPETVAKIDSWTEANMSEIPFIYSN
ncbi:putative sulfotransferase 1 [Halocaridina rubra]|uniref:Sulfotransferase 1 n=1 Tax=Halocaridina rubra TaxID=373956 RepID=A0AAN8X158_HALRR